MPGELKVIMSFSFGMVNLNYVQFQHKSHSVIAGKKFGVDMWVKHYFVERFHHGQLSFVESKCVSLLRLRTKTLRNCSQQFFIFCSQQCQNLVCILGQMSNHHNLSQCFIIWRVDLLEWNVVIWSKPIWKCKVSKPGNEKRH